MGLKSWWIEGHGVGGGGAKEGALCVWFWLGLLVSCGAGGGRCTGHFKCLSCEWMLLLLLSMFNFSGTASIDSLVADSSSATSLQWELWVIGGSMSWSMLMSISNA